MVVKNKDLIDKIIETNSIDLSAFTGNTYVEVFGMTSDTDNGDTVFKSLEVIKISILDLLIRELIDDIGIFDNPYMRHKTIDPDDYIGFLLAKATSAELAALIFVASEVAKLEGASLNSETIELILKTRENQLRTNILIDIMTTKKK
jgi:hypothetical protein